MLIQQVPQEFQPIYRSNYPGYSAGKNIEEICYDYFINQQSSINSDYIYLPVFWTSYYVTHGYGQNINGLYNWLSTLDKTKKYFTIVQYASGIHVQNFDLNITVFSAGGGGLNIKNISKAISITKPPGIDISSGLEIKKGVKDPELIKEFVAKCRNL